MVAIVINSRCIGTGLKEGALLSIIGWEKGLTHKSNLKKKPMRACLTNSHWFVTMITGSILRIPLSGVLED